VGVTELLIVLTILLLVFGAKRVPQLGRSLGRGIRDFREGMAEASREDDDAAELRARKDEEVEEPSPGETAPEAGSHPGGEENSTRIGQKT
jgi:sec-independent protein translocase protein TatA